MRGPGWGGSRARAGCAKVERRRELGGRGEPVGRELLERGEDGVFDFLGHALALPAEGGRLLGHHLGDDRLRRAAGERRIAGEHLVGHASQRVDVGPRGDLALAHRLLGAHVVRRAEAHSGLGHPAAAGAGDGERNAEVGHERAPVVDQDVLGLDVAVDHAVAVGVVERGGHLGREADGVADRELLLAAEPIAEALAFDERHDVPGGAVRFAAVDEAEDVGVLQGGDRLDLAEEPLGADHGGQLGAEHLDGDPAVVPEVLGEVDGGHAALAELPLDAVAVGEDALQAGHRLGHSRGLGWGRWKMEREEAAGQRDGLARRSAWSRLLGWGPVSAGGRRSSPSGAEEAGRADVRALERSLPAYLPNAAAPSSVSVEFSKRRS